MSSPADPARAQAEVRQDIQFLRGIAVLAVLLYHAEVVPLAGGYLGVDIFFVISGYLITRNIVQDLKRGRFSFSDFYFRRARRLLPAAYATLIVTTLLASKVLTEDRWHDFVAQLIGTVTFTANIVLPFQSGYFETAAATKPLLHTWSLSVEEQYYLLAPLLLWLLRPSWRIATLSVLAAVSFTLCAALVSDRLVYWRVPEIDSQQFAFFMLPTRAWEMLVGSLLACLPHSGSRFPVPRVAKVCAFVALLAICALPMDSVHPRGDALAAVLLTAFLIAGSSTWLGASLAVRTIAKVGDWSYSLYLVHWPLFALATSAYLGQVPTSVRVSLLGLSLVLAYLQYTYVEQRFRHRSEVRGRGRTSWLIAASLAVAALPHALASVRLTADPRTVAYLHERNRGLSAACASGIGVTDPQACSTSPQPRVAVWGDSYAMHLVPGLLALEPVGPSMIQITKAACAPIPGVASLDENYDEAWARGCLAFNDRAIELLRRIPSIRYVIMSSPYAGYLNAGDLKLFIDGEATTGDQSIALSKLVRTVQALQADGKVIILVAPPPKTGFDIGACHEQRSLGLLVLGREHCDVDTREYLTSQRAIIDAITDVGRQTGAQVVWFDALLCSDGICKTTAPDGSSLYRDQGHLSTRGSTWAVPRLGINSLLQD